jgi:hypothetical protein
MKATKNVCVDRFSKNLFTKIKRRRFSLKSKNKYNSGNYELEMCWDILLWLLHRRVTIHRFHAFWSKNVWPTDIWSTPMLNEGFIAFLAKHCYYSLRAKCYLLIICVSIKCLSAKRFSTERRGSGSNLREPN